jgi:hypothetical protein
VDLTSSWDTADCSPSLANLARTGQLLSSLELLMRVRAGPSDSKPILDRIADMKNAIAEVQNALFNFRQALINRRQAIQHLIGLASVRVVQTAVTRGTSIGTLENRTKMYLSADVGVLSAPQLNSVAAYAGVNIYTRPINKNVPLKGLDFRRRFAFNLGITLTSIKKTGIRDDLFSSSAAIAGAGVRVTDAIRVSSGVLIFKELDPNPLLDRSKVTTSPYISVSLDWDVKATLGKLGDTLFK